MQKIVSLFLALLCAMSLFASNGNSLTHPRLLVNQDAIDDAKSKIEKYEWAARNSQELLAFADSYKVPRSREFTVRRGINSWRSLGYSTKDAENLFKVALASTLVEKSEYVDKLILFIEDVIDPKKGYSAVGAATSGVEVHEGNFFLHLAAICDILYAREDALTADQKASVESVMRQYLEKSKDDMAANGIMNHQASSNSAAVVVSMFLQDEELFNHFVEADGGMVDHIATGFMSDGWWFEGTANYCYLVTDIYFRLAQVFQNNGLDLYGQKIASRPMDPNFQNAKEDFTGMKFAIWGAELKPYRSLRDVAVAYIPMMDENGVLVASNDTSAMSPADFYELAYKEYGGKELAWVLSKSERDSWISLFYGVGKLPKAKDPRTKSATLPNIGLTALRSQGRESVGENQLQAYVKFGSHGGWHGHFDRASLQALDKYGRKFFGTEMCWFGYISAQYKELVQTSASHNMVVVDEMQQEALPSSQPLFYAGKMMQMSVVETQARWRPIPLNNIEKFPPWHDFDYVTEPILQRRLSIVTDDYLLMVDYLSSNEVRQYDWLLHPKGFVGVEGAAKVGEVKDVITEDVTSPLKYFTQAQWYKPTSESVKFEFCDDGVGLDVYALSPQQSEMIYAHYPTTGRKNGFKNDPERRTIAVRVDAKDVVFINLLEPHKGESVIENVEAKGENRVEVVLKSGVRQSFMIENIRGEASEIEVTMTQQTQAGKSRSESNK